MPPGLLDEPEVVETMPDVEGAGSQLFPDGQRTLVVGLGCVQVTLFPGCIAKHVQAVADFKGIRYQLFANGERGRKERT